MSVVVEIIREKCNVVIQREREIDTNRMVTLYDNEINVNKYVDLNWEQLAMQIPRKIRLFCKFLRTYLRDASVLNEIPVIFNACQKKNATNFALIKTLNLLSNLFENFIQYTVRYAKNINRDIS